MLKRKTKTWPELISYRTSTMKSLTIAGRWNVNLHNLNNEGTEGNFIQPRTVTVVRRDRDGEPRLFAVNAISGDMMKHIHADYFRQIALDDGAGDDGYKGDLPLSRNSIVLDPNRISTEPEMVAKLTDAKQSNSAILDYVIERCSLTDVHGILMTAPKRMLPRKSRIEFGWTVAVPEVSQTGHFIHVKYAVENATKYNRDKDATNQGQALFHRPASSAEYAFLAHIEADRIGINDLTLESPVSQEARRARVRATLHALIQTLAHPYGAGRSQQAPHVGGFSGVIVTSNSRMPAATVSPLEDDFREQADAIVAQMNRLGGHLELKAVDSIAELASAVADLSEGSGLNR
jgi:CRISPR-associated protein Cst2